MIITSPLCVFPDSHYITGIGLSLNIIPTCSESIMSTQVDPSLPDGIKISSEGVITGSVVDNFDSVTFTIIFNNINGSSTATISIESINALTTCYYNIDKDIVYSFVKGEPSRMKITCQRKPDKFRLLDSLPKGLIFYEDTGFISGSAEEIKQISTYTILAINTISSLDIKVKIEIIEKKNNMFVPNLEYRVSEMSYSVGRKFDPTQIGRWGYFENETEIPNQYVTYLPQAYFLNGDVFDRRWYYLFGRMHGYILCRRTGKYKFHMNADDMIQFYFNNMSEIATYTTYWDEWSYYEPPYELKAGNYYEIGALFYQEDGGFNMHIQWQLITESNSYQIPEENLYHIQEHISDLIYEKSTYFYKVNEEFSFTYQTISGNPTVWNIKPDLPPGISFSQGKISGKATTISIPELFTITASNDISSTSYQIGFGIVDDSKYSNYNNGVIVSYYTRDRNNCEYDNDKYPNAHPDIYHLAVKRIETELNYEYKSESYDGLPGYLDQKFNVEYNYFITLDSDGNYEYDIESTDENYFWMYSEGETGSASFTDSVRTDLGDNRLQTYIRAYLRKSTIQMWMTSCRGSGIYPTGGSINMAGGPDQIERQPIPIDILNYQPPSPFYYTYLYIKYVSRAKITPNEPLFYMVEKSNFDLFIVDTPLPYGLSLNSENGVITGIPYVDEQEVKTYKITATNTKTQFYLVATIEIGVVKLPIPSNLKYYDKTTGYLVTSIQYAVNQEINILQPQLTNSDAVKYYTEPSLPSGITIDPYTGIISGKPRQTYGSIVTIYADRKGLITSTTLTVIISQCGEGLQYFEIHFDVKDPLVSYTVYKNKNELLTEYKDIRLPSNTLTIYSYCGINTFYQLNINSNITGVNDIPPSYYVYIGSTLIHYEELQSGYQNKFYTFSNSIPGLPSIVFNNNNTLSFYNYLENSHTGHIVNGIDSVTIEPPLPNSLSFDITTMTVSGIVDEIGDSFHNFILKNSKGTSNIAIKIHSTTCPEDKTAFYIYFYGNDKSSQAQVKLNRNSDGIVLIDSKGTLEPYKRTAWYFCEIPDIYTLTLDSNDGNTWDGATTISVYLEGHIEMYFGKYRSNLENTHQIDLNLLATPSSSWKYHYSDEIDPGYGWKEVNFYDQHWDIATPGNYKKRYGITSYYRKIVTIENLDKISSFQAAFQFDGGIIAYINEIEFYRYNLPEDNNIDYFTPPFAMLEDIYYHHVSGPIEYLKVGKNIISVEVHIFNSTHTKYNPFGGMFDIIEGNGEKSCSLKTTQRIQTDTNMYGGWLSENPGLLLDGDKTTPFAGEGKDRYIDFYYPNNRREYINSYKINGVRHDQDIRSPIEWKLSGYNEVSNEFELIHYQPEYELNHNGNMMNYYLVESPKKSYNRFRWEIIRTGDYLPGYTTGWLETTDFLFYTCSIQICPEEDNWPETSAGSIATISCPTNYNGKIPRECLNVDGKAIWGRIPSMNEYCTIISFTLQFERVIYYPNEILYNEIIYDGLECSNIYLTTTEPSYIFIDNNNIITSTSDSASIITKEEVFIINIAGSCSEIGKDEKIYDVSFILDVKLMQMESIPLYFYFLNSYDSISSPSDLKNENMIIRYNNINFDSIDNYHIWNGMPKYMLKDFAINGNGFMMFNNNGNWKVRIEYIGSIVVEFDNKIVLEDSEWDEIKSFSLDVEIYSKSKLKQFSIFYIGRYNKRKYLKVLSKYQDDSINIHNNYYSMKESSFNYNTKKYICEIGRKILEISPIKTIEIENSIFSVNSGDLPTGLIFNAIKGTITGTPSILYDGDITITANHNSISYNIIIHLKIENKPNIPNKLDIYDCSNNKVNDLIFIKSSYLPCDGYKIVTDEPMGIGLYPEYDFLELNIINKTINYYSNILEEKELYLYGETEYGEKINSIKLKVIDCEYTTYTIILNGLTNTNGIYIFKQKNSNIIINQNIIQSDSSNHFGICTINTHELTITLTSGEVDYMLRTFDNILLEEKIIKCDIYPCNYYISLDTSNEEPQINHPLDIQYEANIKKIINPIDIKLVSYRITNSHPNGIEISSNGILSILLPLCIDYNINILAENQKGNKEYIIKLRCTTCEVKNNYKIIFSRLLDIGSSRENMAIYYTKNNEEIISETYSNSGPMKITKNITLCLNDDVDIIISDGDSSSWTGDSLLTIYTPLEMVYNQLFYNKLNNNKIHINKPILNYDEEWRIDYLHDYSSDQKWLNIDYDDSQWDECVYPNCNFSKSTSLNGELRINMRKKVFISENIGELIFDFIYNDSFVLIINNEIIDIFNGKILSGDITESVIDHSTYHNTTIVSNKYFKTGEFNIICVYYYKLIKYDPLFQIAIYPIYYNSILSSFYYPASRDIFDLISTTQRLIECNNKMKISFGFHIPILFNSYKIYSSILTQDIQWSIYASLSSSNNVYLSSGYGRFNEDKYYIIPNPIPSKSYYIQIDECNSIKQFIIKDINITLNNEFYCNNHVDGYFATSVGHYSVISCPKPWYGVVKKKCVLNNNNKAEWSMEEDDSLCDFKEPNSLSLENNITIIKTYLNSELNEIRVINYNIKEYEDIYILPELPQGILFDKENGIIYGKPNDTVINQLYSILVYNKNGRKYLLFNISIRGLTDSFTYPSTSALINTNINIKPDQAIHAENIYIYPPLPNGLNINKLGEVSGKLSQPNDDTVFYVNYENPTGEMGTELNIVISGAPTIYDYENTPFEISQSINFNSGKPIIRGVIDHYSCDSLPIGLDINSKTGIITGNPQIIDTTTHKCTAENSLGKITSIFRFTILERTCKTDNNNNNNWNETIHGMWIVNTQMCKSGTSGNYFRYCSDDLIPKWSEIIDNCKPNVPSGLRYDNPIIFNYQQEGNHYLPTYNGIITSYEIEPTLPEGLLFNNENGEISGKPMIVLTNTYIITGSNENGKISTVITLIINGRYCKNDGKWPSILIGSYSISDCGNNKDGLSVRYCYDNNNNSDNNSDNIEGYWSNVTEHCLSNDINLSDRSINYYLFNITFNNISFVNDSNVDYILTSFLEYSSNITPVAFVSKYFEETDRYLRLYTIIYQFKYQVKMSRKSEYLSSIDKVIISPLFQEYMITELPQLGINYQANTEMIEHLKGKTFVDKPGFIVLMIFISLIILILIGIMIFIGWKYKIKKDLEKEKEQSFSLQKQRSRIIMNGNNLTKSESLFSLTNNSNRSISPNDIVIPPNINIPPPNLSQTQLRQQPPSLRQQPSLSVNSSNGSIIRIPPYRIAPDGYSFSSNKRNSRTSSKVAPSPTISMERTLSGFPLNKNNRFLTKNESVSGILRTPTDFSHKNQKFELKLTSPTSKSRVLLSPNSPNSPNSSPISPFTPSRTSTAERRGGGRGEKTTKTAISPFSPTSSSSSSSVRRIPLERSGSVKLVGNKINESNSMIYSPHQSVDLRKFAIKGSDKISPSKSISNGLLFSSPTHQNNSILLSPQQSRRKKRLLSPRQSTDNTESNSLFTNKSERPVVALSPFNLKKKTLLTSLSQKHIKDMEDDDLDQEIHFTIPDFTNETSFSSLKQSSSITTRDQISELLGTTNLGHTLHNSSSSSSSNNNNYNNTNANKSMKVGNDNVIINDVDENTLKIDNNNNNNNNNEMKNNEFDVQIPKEAVFESKEKKESECYTPKEDISNESNKNDISIPKLNTNIPLKSPRRLTPRKTLPTEEKKEEEEEENKSIPDLRINENENIPLKSPRRLTPRKTPRKTLPSEEKKEEEKEENKSIPDLRININENENIPLKSPRRLTPRKTPKRT